MDDLLSADSQYLSSARMGELPPWGFYTYQWEASWREFMTLLVLVPFESPTGTLKILFPTPQAILLPATIHLETWGQDAGMYWST